VQFVLLLIALACVFIIILGIQSIAYIINSVLLAAVITLAILPLPRKMIQRGMKPTLALVLSLLLIVFVLGSIFVVAFISVDSVVSGLAAPDPEPTTPGPPDPEDLLAQIQSMVTKEDVNQLLGSVVSVAGQIGAQFFAVMMIFIFMLSAVITTPISEQLGRATNPLQAGRITELTKDVQRYISITTLVNALVGLGNTIFLLIMGVPFAGLWGIFAWLTGYIPSVGFWLALIPPVLLAWVTQDPQTAAIVFAGYVVINGSVENIIKPRVMGEGLNMSPLIIFVSLFFWGSILGAVGAILAVPLTMMVLSSLDSFEATRFLVVLAQPASSSEEHEKKEANLKLRDLWGKISRGDDKEAEEKTSKS
jgi:predicted PurR-regulated permease PerM